MTQLDLSLSCEGDEEEADNPGNFHLVPTECVRWYNQLLAKLPEGRLKERFTDVPAMGIAPFTFLNRVVDILSYLNQGAPLSTRLAAARQLADSTARRSNELQDYEMCYLASLLPAAGVTRLLSVQGELLRGQVHVPEDMLPREETALTPPPRPDMPPPIPKSLPTLGKVFRFKPKPIRES